MENFEKRMNVFLFNQKKHINPSLYYDVILENWNNKEIYKDFFIKLLEYDNYDKIRIELGKFYIFSFKKYFDIFNDSLTISNSTDLIKRINNIKECFDFEHIVIRRCSLQDSIGLKLPRDPKLYKETINNYKKFHNSLISNNSPIINNALKIYDEYTKNIDDPDVVLFFRNRLKKDFLEESKKKLQKLYSLKEIYINDIAHGIEIDSYKSKTKYFYKKNQITKRK